MTTKWPSMRSRLGSATIPLPSYSAGMTPAEPLANVYWPDWISQGEKINAAMEGPYPVAEALDRAEILCALWAYKRVIIALQYRATWRAEWGALREIEGLD